MAKSSGEGWRVLAQGRRNGVRGVGWGKGVGWALGPWGPWGGPGEGVGGLGGGRGVAGPLVPIGPIDPYWFHFVHFVHGLPMDPHLYGSAGSILYNKLAMLSADCLARSSMETRANLWMVIDSADTCI